MTTAVDTLPHTASVGDARYRFATHGHGAYPILDGTRLAGIVTRHDVLRDEGIDDQPVLDHAAREVVSARPTDTAQAALRIMVDEQVEHVPVVDAGTDGDDRLVGICTRTDLLKVRRRQLELERPQAGLVHRVTGNGNRPRATVRPTPPSDPQIPR